MKAFSLIPLPVLALWLLVATWQAASWAAPSPETASPPSSGANAALYYYQAFELMPPTLKSRTISGALQSGTHYPLNKAVQAYVRASRNSLRLARFAAGMPYCNWGHDVSRWGPFTQLPELTKAIDFERNLIPLAVRLAWSQGHWNTATKDFSNSLVLAHRLGQGDGSIGLIIEYQTEIKLAELVGIHLMALPPAAISSLQAAFTRLQAPTSAAKMLAGDAQAHLLWLRRAVRTNHLKHLWWGVCWWNKLLPRLSDGGEYACA
ncbi:MAG: hypothetical protein HKL95_01730 [Phycisphaerae bacterium]|nr:hypothetical protein [Phycisphaerae bacterium]